MKKFILALCAAALSAALILPAAADRLPRKLAVTYVKAPLNIPSIVARRLSLFESAFPGVSLSFPELIEGPKQTAALAAGEVAFAGCLGSTSALLAASEGLDLRIIGIYSRSPKAFMIVAGNPAIKEVGDLKGKKIAGPKGTILHQLLAAALADERMTARDVEFNSMDIPSAAAALASGGADAALLAGPAAVKALKSGALMLKNGEGLVDATTVIATTEKFLSRYPSAAGLFMAAHREALARMESNPLEAARFTRQETGLSADDIDTMREWYDFDPQIREADVEELERTREFMLSSGLQRKRIDVKAILKKF